MRTAFVLAAALAAWPAAAQDTSLEIREQAGVRYVLGGVGEEERDQMVALRREFNLELVFAAKGGGNFLAGVEVAVRDGKGREVLRTTADAPILLARVPAGRYTVEATYDGQAQKRAVDVGAARHRQVALYFEDPAGRESAALRGGRSSAGASR